MSQKKILVVDDEDGIRNLLSTILSSSYKVKSAKNGKDALDVLKTFPANLLITDINMPAMDGIKLINEIRKNNKSIKIIVLSTETDVVMILEKSVDKFMSKPFELPDLLNNIQNLINVKKI